MTFRLLPSLVNGLNQIRLYRTTPTLCTNIIKLSKEIDYDKFEQIRKEKSATIIDVREIEELINTSVIPGSINIPLGDIETAFSMNQENFEKQFQSKLPKSEDPIIMLCLKGIRAEKARKLLEDQFGFRNTGTYVGSYSEWISQQQK